MMRLKKLICTFLSLVCMLCFGISISIQNANVAKAEAPTVALTKVDTEYNNSVWGGATMAVGLIFDKNFTAKAYDGNEGGFDAPIVSSVKSYTKINGQSGVIQLSFLVEENATRIVFLYDNSLLTVPEGQEYTTFTIEAGAPFGGEYLPAVTLYLVDGKWQATEPVPEPDPVVENVTVTNIHNRNGGDQKLLLFLSNSDYETANTVVDLSSVNVLDYVKVYTSETEYKTLREIYQGNAQAKVWGEENALGFQIDAAYHGTAVYAVEIKAGAQFPATANSYTTYEVSEDITYYNNDYQSANAELNGWAVSWTTEKPVLPEPPVEPEPPVDSDSSMEPETSDSSTEPETSDSSTEPETSDSSMEPETSDSSMEPETSDSSTEPETSVEPEPPVDSDSSMEPETSDSSMEPETSVEPEAPVEPGTPDVAFVDIHNDNNNSVWGGATRAVRLVFSDNFTAKAYDGNAGGYNATVIAAVRNYVKINGQSLGNLSFLQIDNENSITFLYDESLLVVPEGQEYTMLTIEEGAPFGGRYLPAVTLYFNGEVWLTSEPVPDPDPVTEYVTVTNIHNRKGGDQRLLIFLSNSDYTVNNTVVDLSSVNVLDYVNVYTSETEYKTLREIYQGNAQAKVWGKRMLLVSKLMQHIMVRRFMQ